MNTGTTGFNYQATLHIVYNSDRATIDHLLKENEIFEEKVEILNNSNENYQIYINLLQINGTVKLEALILEKKYLDTQNLDDFIKYAEKILVPCLNRIRFLYSSYPQDVKHCLSVKTPEGKSYVIASAKANVDSSSAKIIGVLNKSTYQNLCSFNNSDIDEIIEDYLLILQFQDAELRLISLHRLYERIGESVTGNSKYTITEGKAYYKDKGKTIIEINFLAIATRNLVSHGKVTGTETINALNNELGTPSATFHEFNRKDEKHIELIKASANNFASVIKDYLKDNL